MSILNSQNPLLINSLNTIISEFRLRPYPEPSSLSEATKWRLAGNISHSIYQYWVSKWRKGELPA